MAAGCGVSHLQSQPQGVEAEGFRIQDQSRLHNILSSKNGKERLEGRQVGGEAEAAAGGGGGEMDRQTDRQ